MNRLVHLLVLKELIMMISLFCSFIYGGELWGGVMRGLTGHVAMLRVNTNPIKAASRNGS